MKHKGWITVLIMLCIGVLLACGGTRPPRDPPTRVPSDFPATPTPSPTPPPTPLPDDPKSQVGTVDIVNNSGQAIWYIYISPSDADDWGSDWLGADIVASGERHTITDIPVGVYDLKAESQSGHSLDLLWNVTIAGEITWHLSPIIALEITNRSDAEITGLYIAEPDSTTWGEDWLAGATIPPGEVYRISDIAPGIYDLRAVDADGIGIEEIYAVDVAVGYTWEIIGRTGLPVGAVLRFEDDFSDNRNNWGLTPESDTVQYIPPTDGEFCILIKSTNLTAWEWYEPFRPEEFVAEIACAIPEGEASCGLGFGPDGDNLLWFEVAPYEQVYALFLLQDAEWQDAFIGWTESKHIVPDSQNYLSMERVGGVVSIYINSVLVGEVETDVFPTGRIGIGGAAYHQGNVMVCMDNLRVWQIE